MTSSISMTLKIKSIETKSDIFPWGLTIKMKHYQIFFYGTYSNLASCFIGHKILKYFSDFHK